MTRNLVSANTSDVVRRLAFWKRKALKRPVVVRNRGRDEVVLMSPAAYERLKRLDREVLSPSDILDEAAPKSNRDTAPG